MWSATHRRWIEIMDEIFTAFMGEDFLTYVYTENLCCTVADELHPKLEYDDAVWESIFKQKMVEREWLENETPRSRRAKKRPLAKTSRRRLFKTRKDRSHRSNTSVSPSSSSGATKKSMSDPCRKHKLKVTVSPIPLKRRAFISRDSAISKQKYSTKRRSSTLPLSKSNDLSPSTPPACTSSTSTSNDLLSSFPAVQTSADSTSLSSQMCFPTTPPTSDSWDQPLPSPQATSTPSSCSSALPSFKHVFSATCPREQMLNCKLPPVDCSITVDQNKLVRLTSSSVCTSVASLKRRPPECVVKAAVTLMRDAIKTTQGAGNVVDIDGEEIPLGLSIGQLGTFSRAGLGQLEWLGEVAAMQYNTQEERQWVLQTPDNLDCQERNEIIQLLYKFPLNHVIAKEGKLSVDVRAFGKLALERYIDDSVIDTAIARMQRELHLQESVLCLPAHTITWLDTGDEHFIRDCFEQLLVNVRPDLLRVILVPVNMNEVHWGLMAVDVSQRKAYFDDGLGWSFPSITYLHVIVKQLHSMFPECDNFSLNHWRRVEAFKRFGMPRQPTDCGNIGSGSCGVGVILSARDFMMSVPSSWTFSEMAVHRKEVMKLLSS